MALLERAPLVRTAAAGVSRLKVLIVSQAFPPFNTSGAVRVGGLARFLADCGHDVRVLTASPLPYPQTLAVEIPPEHIIRTRSFDPLLLLRWLRRSGKSGIAGVSVPSSSPDAVRTQLLRWVGALFAIPEPQVGWYPKAVAAGRVLFASWTPDVIYASALPFTAHIVAARLAASAGVPWIAEFRDHFYGNPYSNLPAWRDPIDRRIERRVVSSASACVTVSAPMAETLRQRYGRRTEVVLNGCDTRVRPLPNPSSSDTHAPLKILYTGLIYPGRRDPSPLFEAIAALGPLGKQVEVIFYGQDLRGLAEQASRYGVAGQVHLRSTISHSASLEEQQKTDVLLLLLWSDSRELGVYTGKLFEYVGAGRQILAVGCENGVAADLIRARRLGVVATHPQAIASTLRRWIEEKRATGHVEGPGKEAKAGLSREEQFTAVDTLMRDLVGQDGAHAKANFSS